MPQSIARKAVEERVAILSDNAAADERFKGKSILIQSVRSAMCTPLMGTDQKVLGILYVDNRTATHSFADEDLEFLIAFGSLAAVGVENSQRSEQLRREALVLSNFQRYFAPNLAAQIAQQEGAVQLGGTKRPVVIFFSDIRGFTPLSETMGPDEIATLLTEYFTEMVEIVFEHSGHARQIHGRRDHGAVGRADRARGRRRPRHGLRGGPAHRAGEAQHQMEERRTAGAGDRDRDQLR